jgi:hypothetical protein
MVSLTSLQRAASALLAMMATLDRVTDSDQTSQPVRKVPTAEVIRTRRPNNVIA